MNIKKGYLWCTFQSSHPLVAQPFNYNAISARLHCSRIVLCYCLDMLIPFQFLLYSYKRIILFLCLMRKSEYGHDEG